MHYKKNIQNTEISLVIETLLVSEAHEYVDSVQHF